VASDIQMESSQSKLSFKRFELPIQRFSKTALPLYINLLNKHEQDISQFRSNKEWDKVRRETLNAQRTISQLEAAVREVDEVRQLLNPEEAREFDKQIKPHKKKAVDFINKFTEICNTVNGIQEITPETLETEQSHSGLRLQYKDEFLPEEIEVERRKAQLETYENLQQDISDLQELFINFSENVHVSLIFHLVHISEFQLKVICIFLSYTYFFQAQSELVEKIEENVEVAQENVQEGERILSKAAKLKTTLYPITGALIGTCIGGPVGLVAGLKFGSMAAIGGTVLGFTGGQVVKKWQENEGDQSQIVRSQTTTDLETESKNVSPNLTTSASIL